MQLSILRDQKIPSKLGGNSSDLYFCTSLAMSGLPKLITLYWSLRRHCLSNFVIWVICDGDDVYKAIHKLRLENINLVYLREIEAWDQDILRVKGDRNPFEYNCTLRPCMMKYLITLNPQITFLTYFDTDIYFLSDPSPIYDEYENASILLTPHRYSRYVRLMGITSHKSGVYNAGWLAFKNNNIGLEALGWWRDRCIEWCRDIYEDGKYGEQKYLDELYERSNGAVAIHHGANVGPWNISDFQLNVDHIGQLYVDEKKLYFYHFHALKISNDESFKVSQNLGFHTTQITNPSYIITPRQKKLIYAPYIRELKKALDLTGSLFIQHGRTYNSQSTSILVLIKNKIKQKALRIYGITCFLLTLFRTKK